MLSFMFPFTKAGIFFLILIHPNDERKEVLMKFIRYLKLHGFIKMCVLCVNIYGRMKKSKSMDYYGETKRLVLIKDQWMSCDVRE